MSREAAQRALRQLCERPAFLSPGAARPIDLTINGVETVSTQIIADLRELAALGSDKAVLVEGWQTRKEAIAADYWGDSATVQSKPFAYFEGTAVIPVTGALINRYSWSWSWATGYNFIRAQLDAANVDPDVQRIVLDVNSYGGTVSGCPETAEAIAKSGKPVLAMVDDSCFSAAYYLASQAKRINVIPSGRAGSIGVVLMHMDVSKALKDYGIQVTLLFAGAHKVDGNPYEPLSADARDRFQVDIDACYADFCATVAKGRGMAEEEVRATEALVYRADEALSIGLIDGVSDMNAAVAAFVSGAECDPPLGDDEDDDPVDDDDNQPEAQENDDMAVKPEATGGEQPSAEAVTASAEALAEATRIGAEAAKTRISAILTHPEAVGRAKQASHMAFETEMSVEDAGKLLAVSAKEAAPVAPVAPAATSRFQAAMAAAVHPEVGADASGEEATGAQPMGKRALASYGKIVGIRTAA